jgi:hypothetical protein
VLGENLSEFTHSLNFWAANEENVKIGKRNISMLENDFSPSDRQKFIEILEAYPVDYIDKLTFREEGGKVFLLFEDDLQYLPDNIDDIIYDASKSDELDSPIHVYLDETGEVIID